MKKIKFDKKELIDFEFLRLKRLFEKAEEERLNLAENLIHQAAFMKVELDDLQRKIQKYGSVQFSSKGSQRQTESAKFYTKLVNSYSTVIRTLHTLLGTSEDDAEDEFDSFLQRVQGE